MEWNQLCTIDFHLLDVGGKTAHYLNLVHWYFHLHIYARTAKNLQESRICIISEDKIKIHFLNDHDDRNDKENLDPRFYPKWEALDPIVN